MYAEERRQVIVDRARRDGRVEVARLAADFAVTTETVRRDLTELEAAGLLRRVHGGAIPVERLRHEAAVVERAARMAAEKARIAKAALAHVPHDATLLLDAGTTTQALAAALPDDRDLTVVTNSLPIATELAPRPRIRLHLLGGRVRERTLATVDDWTLRTLRDLTPDVAFVATNGLSVAGGLTTPDPSEAGVKRAMVEAGRRVVLLADHSKLEQDHFVRFADVADVDVLITDAQADPAHCEALEAAGLEVVRA
ncbi:DeoR/GlpR family DNA-binding transcription regulator [Egicoccus sp. AB-alg2]|uniref:DeoR/GlpR family DNA-binding transcription regulator n=1 Tax=Egicoccus sp. AB-alg2 TaxID=3242693 RepID=UPI00359EDDC9